ncbi:hypothetical protein L484_005938 [Morus notabilis]|uniref:Uncharacterized protein n=1 Tax=Morus notabilis TaxID=981085 RepID=W9QSK1_9ROSA|nr:hypothetical protein L484_005938 [Morus notabilis]
MNYRYNYCPRPAPNLSTYGRTQGQHRMMPTYCDPIASNYMDKSDVTSDVPDDVEILSER